MTTEEKIDFIDLVNKRFNGEKVGDELPIAPDSREIEEAKLMQGGNFYCFEPLECWCDRYDRG